MERKAKNQHTNCLLDMNKLTKENNPLGLESIPRLLKNFALPSIVAMVVSALYNIVDQIFIGQGVGYLGNAATNVSFPLTTISLSIALLISVGGATRYSLLLGEGDVKMAKKTIGASMSFALFSSLLFVTLVEFFLVPLLKIFGATSQIMEYATTYSRITTVGLGFMIITNYISNIARADGSPRFSMNCLIIGAVINTVLDPLFIFIFKWGVAGAAFATLIGQVASGIMALNYTGHFKNIDFSPRDLHLDLIETKKICALGISASLNQVAIAFVQVVLNNALTYYGSLSIYGSEIPLASSGIILKIQAILIALVVGINQGALPIFGFNYGAKKYKRVIETYKYAIIWGTVVSSLSWLLFEFATNPIISLFGTGDGLYLDFAIKFMRVFLFFTFLLGYTIISSGFFSAIGMPIKGLILSLTRQVIFFIPLVLIMPKFMGLDGILYAAPISDAASFCITLILVIYQLRKIARMSELHTN